jgi:hypothetical protein
MNLVFTIGAKYFLLLELDGFVNFEEYRGVPVLVSVGLYIANQC